jgi:hypothetical protein
LVTECSLKFPVQNLLDRHLRFSHGGDTAEPSLDAKPDDKTTPVKATAVETSSKAAAAVETKTTAAETKTTQAAATAETTAPTAAVKTTPKAATAGADKGSSAVHSRGQVSKL